jgi:hypothetical protein
MGSVAVTDTTLHERVQPTVEALEIGGERLGALIQNVFAVAMESLGGFFGLLNGGSGSPES